MRYLRRMQPVTRFQPRPTGRLAERRHRRPVRYAHRRGRDERVRGSRRRAAVVRRERPRDTGIRARCRGRGLQAGETFYTWQRGIPELRQPRSRAYTERLYGIRLPGRPHLGHDRRHAGDPAVLPVAARSRRQHRDRVADLAEHHLGHPAGARRAALRRARPRATMAAGRSTCRRSSTRSTGARAPSSSTRPAIRRAGR